MSLSFIYCKILSHRAVYNLPMQHQLLVCFMTLRKHSIAVFWMEEKHEWVTNWKECTRGVSYPGNCSVFPFTSGHLLDRMGLAVWNVVLQRHCVIKVCFLAFSDSPCVCVLKGDAALYNSQGLGLIIRIVIGLSITKHLIWFFWTEEYSSLKWSY